MDSEAIMNGIIGGLFFIMCVWLLYKAFSYPFQDAKDEFERSQHRSSKHDWNGSWVSNDREVLLDLEKSDVQTQIKSVYDYTFPELLKKRYMSERDKTEQEFQLVQLALKDWFSIFAGNTNRTQFFDFPSKEVDELWHMFILFTKDYREFCQNYIGQFLDHVPLEDNKSSKFHNLKNLMATFKEVREKNDCLLFKIDNLLGINNKYDYYMMNHLYILLNLRATTRTLSEAEELYNYSLISSSEFQQNKDTLVTIVKEKAQGSSISSSSYKSSSVSSSCGSSCSSSSSISSSSSSCVSSSSCGGGGRGS
jgi:hypothetical protein